MNVGRYIKPAFILCTILVMSILLQSSLGDLLNIRRKLSLFKDLFDEVTFVLN